MLDNNEVQSTTRMTMTKLKIFVTDIWFDALTLGICGGLCAAIYTIPRVPTHYIAYPSMSSGRVLSSSMPFSYPYLPQPSSSLVTGLTCICGPLAIIIVFCVWRGTFFDCVYAILGFSYAIVIGSTFQVMVKQLIGGLRPHFLTVCKPKAMEELQRLNYVGSGFDGSMFTPEQLCTGDTKLIKAGLTSFPSGHSEVAFAAMTYLSIYLLAHLRVQHGNRPRFWKMLLITAPLLYAVWIAGSMVQTYHHFASDVWFGGMIGVLSAIGAYRMVYEGILNPGLNSVLRRREKDFRDGHVENTQQGQTPSVMV